MTESDAIKQIDQGVSEMIATHLPAISAAMWRQFLGERLQILVDADNARRQAKENRRKK